MKTNKRELTVFAVCAYAVPFLMMPLLYICLQNGQDTSIFAHAQMFYPAAGVMLAFLLARRPDTPKRFYILHLLVTAVMLIMSVLSAAAPQAVYRSVSACPSVQIAPPTSPARSRSPQMGERGESESTNAAYSSLLMRIVLISCAQYGRVRAKLCKNKRPARNTQRRLLSILK